MVSLMRQEIDQGRLVRIVLPGAKVPVLVEDASRWANMLVIQDPQGGRYYSADPAGLVVLAEPVSPPDPNEKPYWMKVDE